MNGFSRTQTIVEWIESGDFAVAVEVEAIFPPDAPTEACLRPETVRWLESLEDAAARGDIATLRAAGRVYRRDPVST